MRGKLLLLSSALLLAGMTEAGAQGVMKDGFNTEAFPEVSFIWHEDNPERLSKSDFQSLTEGGKTLEFKVEPIKIKADPEEKQYVIFLWEDLAYHGANLHQFSKESLRTFFENAGFDSNDKINVSVYGRRDISAKSYLTDLTDGFVSDERTLLNAIDSYERTKQKISNYPNRADIFPAVSEALEILHADAEGSKAVVVLTAGYPLDNSSASSDMNARLLAEKYNIPVHFLQYGRDHGYSAKLSSFAPLTYGTFSCFADMDQETNVRNAASVLKDIYEKQPQRSLGNDYKVTFTSQTERGDDAVMVEFKVNGFSSKEQLVPPAFSLLVYIKENPVVAGLCLLVVLGLLTLGIVFYVRRRVHDKRQFKALREENKQNREEAMNAISDARNAISDTRDSLDRRIDQVHADKWNDELQTLEEALRRRSVYPRLIYQVNGNTSSYVVCAVQTTIGREASNDVVLNDSSVSRRHAKIVFNGVAFEIVDEGSMNGVLVNGVRIEGPTPIKNGDKLALGGILITVNI